MGIIDGFFAGIKNSNFDVVGTVTYIWKKYKYQLKEKLPSSPEILSYVQEVYLSDIRFKSFQSDLANDLKIHPKLMEDNLFLAFISTLVEFYPEVVDYLIANPKRSQAEFMELIIYLRRCSQKQKKILV